MAWSPALASACAHDTLADMTASERAEWPTLQFADWKETYATVHMWLQVVGKVALAQAPPINHSWAVAFQVTPRGLSTHLLPHGARSFTIEFDFIDHELVVRASDGDLATLRADRPIGRGFLPCGDDDLLQRMGLGVGDLADASRNSRSRFGSTTTRFTTRTTRCAPTDAGGSSRSIAPRVC